MSKKLVVFFGNVCLVIILAALLLPGCSMQAAPTAPVLTTPAATTPAVAKPATTAPVATTPTATKPSPAPAAEVFKWKLQSCEVAGTKKYIPLEMLAKKIEEESQGRFLVSVFPAGALVKVVDMLDGIKSNIIQIADASLGFYLDFVPEGAITTGIPGILRTPSEMGYIWYELGVANLVREAFAEQGCYWLTTGGMSPVHIWAKKPLVTLDDFKGLKARGMGMRARMLEKMGVAITFIPHEEGYTALQLGTVQAYETAIATYIGMKHYEICKYVMLPAILAVTTSDIFASPKARNALPADLKGLLEAECRSLPWQYTYLDLEATDVILQSLPKYGAQTVQMSPEVIKVMTDIGVGFLDEYAQKSPRAQKMADIIKGYMKTKGYIN